MAKKGSGSGGKKVTRDSKTGRIVQDTSKKKSTRGYEPIKPPKKK